MVKKNEMKIRKWILISAKLRWAFSIFLHFAEYVTIGRLELQTIKTIDKIRALK